MTVSDDSFARFRRRWEIIGLIFNGFCIAVGTLIQIGGHTQYGGWIVNFGNICMIVILAVVIIRESNIASQQQGETETESSDEIAEDASPATEEDVLTEKKSE